MPNLKGIDPDDSFSSVPYEKGFVLLYYLESLVGGPGMVLLLYCVCYCTRLIPSLEFDKYLRAHVEHFKYKTITTKDWKDFFLSYFHKQVCV